MGLPGRSVRSLAALTGGAMLIALPWAPVAFAAAPAPTVTITDVTDGQTVSGTVDVTAQVTSTPGDVTQSVDFWLSGPDRGIPDGVVQIPVGTCLSTCTVHWSMDTTASTPGVPGGAGIPLVLDGPQTLGVSTTTSVTSGGAQDTVQITVDNHRPTVTVPGSPVPFAQTSGDQQAPVTALPQLSATAPQGTTVTDVQFDAQLPGSVLVAHLAPAAGGGSTWTGKVDTSQVPAGYYPGFLVAVDSDGMTSNWVRVELEVDHGFTVLPGGPTALATNWTSLKVGYTYPQWTSPNNPVGDPIECSMADGGYAVPVRISTLVDGTTWNSAPITAAQRSNGPSSSAQSVCEVPAAGDSTTAKPLPVGRHQLTYVVTDSDGITRSASQWVGVGARPLTATVPNGLMTVHMGSVLHLVPKVQVLDGFSRVQSWSFQWQGKVLASGSYPTPPSLTWTTPAKYSIAGISLSLVSDSGVASTVTLPVQTGYWTATTLHASATHVTKGTEVTLAAGVRDEIGTTWQAMHANYYTVTLQWRLPGSSTWYNGTVQQVSVIMKQPAAFHDRVARSVYLRAVTTFGYYTPYVTSISAPVYISVRN